MCLVQFFPPFRKTEPRSGVLLFLVFCGGHPCPKSILVCDGDDERGPGVGGFLLARATMCVYVSPPSTVCVCVC